MLMCVIKDIIDLMEARVQKLLIMVGEQAVELEARDYRKLSDELAGSYLKNNPTEYKDILLQLFARVVRAIPLKAHFYAGLTADVAKTDPELAGKLLQIGGNNLQTDLSEGNYLLALNSLSYLAETMNISFLNSLTFMTLLEDILNAWEKQQEILIKKATIALLIQILPLCAASLHQKTYHEFKKFIDKLRKNAEGDELCQYIYGQFSKNKLKNYSGAYRLNADFTSVGQHSGKLKINVHLGQPITWCPVSELNRQEKTTQNVQYQVFKKEEGLIVRSYIEQVVGNFVTDRQILTTKIINLTKWRGDGLELKNIIDFLFHKALKSKKPIAECSLIISIKNDKNGFESTAKLVSASLFEMFMNAETFQLSQLFAFSSIFCYIVNNWGDTGFDWAIFTWESTESFIKRKAILQLIIQKMTLLNDKFICPQSMASFQSLKPIFILEDFKGEELEVFQKFQGFLNEKTQADVLVPEIVSERSYEIFLQALFRKTSLSQKHLQVLQQRYHKILEKFQELDWNLINKIRNYFRNSFFHRLFYLKFMISKNVLKFGSYVNYVSKLQDKSQIQMIWIKMQLHELNLEFGKSLKNIK